MESETMTGLQKIISPVDGGLYAERPLADAASIEATLARAKAAQAGWKRTPIAERAAICARFVDAFVARRSRSPNKPSPTFARRPRPVSTVSSGASRSAPSWSSAPGTFPI
jgi:hypothetical protein